jgi:hypothetical protein
MERSIWIQQEARESSFAFQRILCGLGEGIGREQGLRAQQFDVLGFPTKSLR